MAAALGHHPALGALQQAASGFRRGTGKYDVPIGALYYNDIPFINEAAMEIRDTWRFLPRGPLPEKK